eukprot:TRINITY_DN58174_c0_g1_i1.p1 TRINITY_DN58174_c0_g1~~TRINITY_DN58174_c0_g1_i1.p1  ORF type:complete len:533 (-),score=77.05 TRINITY_DN58174_c0_g1_i1:97-1695(-)
MSLPSSWWPSSQRRLQACEKERQKEAIPVERFPCRICHSKEESEDDPLVAPCLCDGSLRFVHNACEQAWLSARRGPRDYRCELCGVTLACRLTFGVRLELMAVWLASACVWIFQIASGVNLARLAVRLLLTLRAEAGQPRTFGGAFFKKMARVAVLPKAELAVLYEELSWNAVAFLVMALVPIVVAHHSLLLVQRPPLKLLGEAFLQRTCIIKIGGCVLVLLHEGLWCLPPAHLVAPLAAWRGLGATLVLDTFLLAFLRVPLQERGGQLATRLARAAARIVGDFLPFAAVFFLWAASIVMILAASLVPCSVLLFRQAGAIMRRRKYAHGSLQLVLLEARLLLRVIAAVGLWRPDGFVAILAGCDRGLITLRTVLEVLLLTDLLLQGRGLECAREGYSQAMWIVALVGEALLLVFDPTGLRGASYDTSAIEGGAGRWSLHGPWSGSRKMSGDDELSDDAGLFLTPVRLQDSAFLLSLTCFLVLHVSVFATSCCRLKQAFVRTFLQVDPSQVVFQDRPASSRSRAASRQVSLEA